jgi:probable F420-dependent oxidoreductase
MRLGLFAMNYGTCADPAVAVEVAQHAEAAGFESLWTAEHVVLPDPQPDGFGIPPTLPFLDPIAAMTLLASHTSTIKVASGVLILPQHHPVRLAKQLATVDLISNGRLIVGLGVGYVPREFEAMGVSMSDRGRRMDDYIAALKSLWEDEHPGHAGPFVGFAGINAFPRPQQRPSLPVVMGGTSRSAARRAVTMSKGWFGFSMTNELLAKSLEDLRAAADEYERPDHLGRLEITITPVGPLDKTIVEAYAQQGVYRMVLLPRPDSPRSHRHDMIPKDQIHRNIDKFAEMCG